MAEPLAKQPRAASDTPSDHSSSLCIPKFINEVLTEADVGIISFVSPHVVGFDCILKNRWEDFIVREVNNGIVASLTCLDPIACEVSNSVELNSQPIAMDTLLSRLTEFVAGCENVLQIEAPNSKQKRSDIHNAIRNLFPHLSSSTVKTDQGSMISVSKSAKAGGFPKRFDRLMPKGLPYCRFVLYKEGKDTVSAINILSRRLHKNPACFGYAGTKDRRAITTQFVTVKGIHSSQLAAVNRSLRGIRVGNFSNVAKPIFLGDLEGNRFTVVLRNIIASNEVVDEAVESWKKYGFVNYYGLQRFGHSAHSKSYEIGRCLIRNEWGPAIDLILLPTDADLPFVRQAKQSYAENGDAASCAAELPSSIEKSLLLGVSKYGKTLNALQKLPRNVRQLYVHSYQSWIWNRVATRRISQLGIDTNHALPGDLYLPNTPYCSDGIESDGLENTREYSGPLTLLPTPNVATSDDFDTVNLVDVVLPVPGFATVSPQNESGDWYTEFLKQDGLVIDDLRHRVKDFALPGSYRNLVVKPSGVSHEIRYYSDPEVPLVRSDLQVLSGTADVIIPSTDHPHRAVILQFTLPKSSYATVAIRELTKTVLERR